MVLPAGHAAVLGSNTYPPSPGIIGTAAIALDTTQQATIRNTTDRVVYTSRYLLWLLSTKNRSLVSVKAVKGITRPRNVVDIPEIVAMRGGKIH